MGFGLRGDNWMKCPSANIKTPKKKTEEKFDISPDDIKRIESVFEGVD